MGLTGLRPSSGKKESKSFKRKLEKKLDFYTKVKDASVSLGAKKAINKKKKLRSRQKKLKAYDLSSLSEFLPSLDVLKKQSDSTNKKLNCKARQKLILKESAKLRAVLNHPTFQSDPFAAIHQYIENTQPPTIGTKDKQSKKTERKTKRNRVKGSSSSTQAMDI